jgi:signal transduction histidine kinase
MRLDFTMLAAIAAFTVGSLAVWANPSRAINRVFGTLSLHAVVWLLCLRSAFMSEDGLFWVRWASAVGVFIPLHLWIVKEVIVLRKFRRMLLSPKFLTFLTFSLLFGAICFSFWFVPKASTPENPLFGLGYYAYISGLLGVYVLLAREAVLEMRSQSGVRRLELQLFLLGGCVAAGAIISVMALRALLGGQIQIRIQPLLVLVFYVATVVAITTHKIFDARQIVLVSAEKALLIGATAVIAFAVDFILAPIMPRSLDLVVTTGLALWFATVFGRWLDQKFHFYPEASRARQAAFNAAGKEAQLPRLRLAFLPILKGWGQTDEAMILSGGVGSVEGGGVELLDDSPVSTTLRRIRWATPERLARERSTPERAALAQFMTDHRLGVLVSNEGPTLRVIVGVGVSASRAPYTYPQVTQLLELAAIIEGALERAQLSAKAQHAEQLATVGLMGASLAHEIRNPLVSIKTFIQLLPNHYQEPAFREKFFGLIGGEVGRIERLTEQLLDMASPKVYAAQLMPLHPVLESGLELVMTRAAAKSVAVKREFNAAPDLAFVDPAAVKQVLLNLCFNAIQAAELKTGDRWLLVSTRNTSSGIELAVSDSGPGIPEEVRAKLFQPFQTTKSSGFGLGLAICKDILGNLNAGINVDPPAPGRGASFRVVFPCRPS